MIKRSLVGLVCAGALALSGCAGRSPAAATATPPPLFTATLAGPAGTATLAATTQAAPVATAAPSDTAAPNPTASSTAAPATATASGVPATATPAVTATPDSNEAVGDVAYQDKLDGKGGWFWTFSDDIATFGVTDGKLKGVMQKANAGWRFTISPDTVQLGSQQVSLNAHTVSCGPNDEYGFMLHLKADAAKTNFDGDLFKLRCDGMASFQVISGTQTTTVAAWKPFAAIKTGAGVDNVLMVWTAGSEYRFYVNGQYLFSANDSTLDSGFYGLYLYDRTAGGETVTFDSLVARTVNK